MALQSTAHRQRAASYQDLARVLLVIAAVVALMLVLTAIFGVHQAGLSYEIVPDPAAAVGLPF